MTLSSEAASLSLPSPCESLSTLHQAPLQSCRFSLVPYSILGTLPYQDHFSQSQRLFPTKLNGAMPPDHRERRRLYELSKRSPSVHSGTSYPCSQKDLDACKRFTHRNRIHHLPRMEATYQLSKHNRITKELSTREKTACKNIKDALQIKDWSPDLAIKAFKDIDTLFFLGRLHGNCLLNWADRARLNIVRGSGIGFTQYGDDGPGQARIFLNSYHIFMEMPNPWVEMWRTILHECWW